MAASPARRPAWTSATWQANLTILSGDIDGNDVKTDGNFIAETPADIQGSNSIHVVWNSNVDPDRRAERLCHHRRQIRGCLARCGRRTNVNASPTLVHLTISGNSGYEGGGMFNHLDSSPTVTQVTFTGNSAVSGGGGMKNYSNSSPLLTNVVFSGNNAYNGGGMFSYASSPLLRNVLFKGKNTATNGGGIYSYEGALGAVPAPPSAATAPSMPAPPSPRTAAAWTIHSTDPVGRHSHGHPGDQSRQRPHHGGIQQHLRLRRIERLEQCLRGGWRRQYRHRSALPRLLRRGDMRLQDSSPAIDAGNNAAVPDGLIVDLDRSLRLVDIPGVPDTGSGTPPIVDMGAYEAHPDAVRSHRALHPAPGSQPHQRGQRGLRCHLLRSGERRGCG